MKILDYSTHQDLNRAHTRKQMVLEAVTAALIFLVPALVLFILSQ